MSKSGLFARFGSKEELQLAAVEEAGRVIAEAVTSRGLRRPRGLPRLWGLCDAFVSYLEEEIFPGGCLIAALAAEYDSRPGPVRDAIVKRCHEWRGALQRATAQAQEEGHLPADVEPPRLAWQLDSFLQAANSSYQVDQDRRVFAWAREAVRETLGRLATPAAPSLA
jgi:AcrR family transcriptional regulator